ncbi:MAG: AgmX/PglI C-terminal domain-containing protein, partial [Cystobacter sp.]
GQQSPPPPAPPAAAPRQDAEPPAAEPPAETQAEAPPEPEPAAQAPAETSPGTTPEPPAPAPSETPADVGSAPAAQVPTSEGTEELDVAPLQLSGPPRVEVDRVVERSRPSFKPCIAQVLRKNPKLRNGKLLIITTVTHSGEVTKVAMDRPDIGTSPSAECFIERAQRMVFPAFEGDDVEVEIPLVLSRS